METGIPKKNRVRRLAMYAVLALIIFLVGFVPMWLKSRKCSEDLVRTAQRLSLADIENLLSSSAIEAQRGDYEPARQSASTFFNVLSAEMEKGVKSPFSPQQIEKLKPLFNSRDGIITLLARNDPASADRLSDLYIYYRSVMGR